MRKRCCVWNGIRYESVAEAARALGISYGAMQGRLKHGHTCDDDLHQARRKPCTWNGIRYESVTDAAKANYITRHAMVQRLQNGYTCDDDLAW